MSKVGKIESDKMMRNEPLVDAKTGESPEEVLLLDPDGIESIEIDLKNSDAEVRAYALWKLEHSLTSPESYKQVKNALKDPSERVRIVALQLMQCKKIKNDYDDLQDSLSSHSNDIRENALCCLTNCDDPRAIDELIRVVKNKNEDSHCQWVANFVLERKDINNVMDQLFDIIKDCVLDGDLGMNKSVFSKLAEIDEERLVQFLIQAIKKRNKKVKCLAASLLASLGDLRAISPLIELLSARRSEIRAEVCGGLGFLGLQLKEKIEIGENDDYNNSKQLNLIIDSLKYVFHNDKNDYVIEKTVYVLFELLTNDELKSFIRLCISHASKEVIKHALRRDKCSLEYLDMETLEALLSHHDNEIIEDVIFYMGDSEDKRFIKPLLNIVDIPKDNDHIPYPKATEMYEFGLEPRYTKRQIDVAQTLLTLGNMRGLSIISESLFDPALGDLDKSGSLLLLKEHGGENDLSDLCNQLIDEMNVDKLNQQKNLGLLVEAAIYLFQKGNVRGLKILENGLLDSSWDITPTGGFQCKLAKEIGDAGNNIETINLFIRILQNTSAVGEEQFDVIVSYLTKWGAVKAIPVLNKYVNSPYCGENAQRAISILTQIKNSHAVRHK